MVNTTVLVVKSGDCIRCSELHPTKKGGWTVALCCFAENLEVYVSVYVRYLYVCIVGIHLCIYACMFTCLFRAVKDLVFRGAGLVQTMVDVHFLVG